MNLTVNREGKYAIVWMTNAEKADPKVMDSLQPLPTHTWLPWLMLRLVTQFSPITLRLPRRKPMYRKSRFVTWCNKTAFVIFYLLKFPRWFFLQTAMQHRLPVQTHHVCPIES